MNPETIHRARVFFAGHVQGVGFRYAVMQVAKGFEVTGFVRNLADGRVEVEAEGAPAEVAAFVAEIEERMSSFIRTIERTSEAGARMHSGFLIR